ncbi:GntR family transcriptional regulator [Bradyrhizobium sp. 35]|nr:MULTISPECIES: GntR family transcriptional regulator [unclassified Bradyrhizobium]MCK1450496.1 GntR family transcriptional regulator [Bradyrhizobium sp. 35]MCK1479647.1 GntR family transcriptional regulator [Bradyrhizobium sp. 197]MCK1518835.1 GntR family transcriptional regulator [Bradyrhizobium sp. 17]
MTRIESTQFAAEQIRNAIITGHFKPGHRLVEQQLIEMLNISRHPVREALRLLAREGFVEIKLNRGASVTAVDADSIAEVYNLRMAMGRLALDHIFAHPKQISDKALKKIEKLAQNALKSSEFEDQAESVKTDLEFQQAIVDATGLQRTMRYFSELTGDIRRFNNFFSVVYTDRKGDAQRYIMRLYKAIRHGRRDEAQKIWSAKFQKALDRYLALVAGTEADGAARAKGFDSSRTPLRRTKAVDA